MHARLSVAKRNGSDPRASHVVVSQRPSRVFSSQHVRDKAVFGDRDIQRGCAHAGGGLRGGVQRQVVGPQALRAQLYLGLRRTGVDVAHRLAQFVLPRRELSSVYKEVRCIDNFVVIGMHQPAVTFGEYLLSPGIALTDGIPVVDVQRKTKFLSVCPDHLSQTA